MQDSRNARRITAPSSYPFAAISLLVIFVLAFPHLLALVAWLVARTCAPAVAARIGAQSVTLTCTLA